MKIGYARVSTQEQNLARQLEALKKNGVKKIFEEKISGKNLDRPELQKMLDYIHEEDEVVVLSLDRLGRNSADLTNIIEEIKRKGAVLNILSLPSFAGVTDTNLKNLLTNLVLEIYKYTAEEERRKIKERQKQGIALAKKRGAYKGGKRLYAPDSPNPQKRLVYNEVVKMLKQKIPISRIARTVGISRMQVYRIRDYARDLKTKQ
ncbi:recombinase family protein [Lactobacillus sp. ESL0679]|uniref:recombinase family protein n=1 Tax=Lactobacillus sp. ESL0679 TaxID=2983209 RepID=UPI0023F99DC7|nr:recombinase family protein [Lactobacillus sp. ESL0679]MDF7683778.1 recombinase family protein [Lactobacillus sp. ESL0679]